MDFRRRTTKHINPGPDDGSLLYMQHAHISKAVWNLHHDQVVRPRRHCRLNFLYPPQQLVRLLQETGFYGASRPGFIPYDHHLISTMLGIPIDGWPIIGKITYDWVALCQESFGLAPPPQNLKGMRLKIKWLDQNFGDNMIPKDPTPLQLQQFTRTCIMRLIGGFLMPDTSGNLVKLMYLPLLQNLGDVRKYSWGGAVLAYLFPILAPVNCVHHPGREFDERHQELYPTLPPLCFRFTDYRALHKSGMHLVSSYRKTIDDMDDHNIVWEPYHPDVYPPISSRNTVVMERRSGEYMQWYRGITHRWVDPEGAGISNGSNFCTQIREWANDEAPRLKDIRYLCDKMLGGRKVNRMSTNHPAVRRLLDEEGEYEDVEIDPGYEGGDDDDDSG
ncbi:serine/threonine-protein phosphatase 7 long form-like protein [Senna tora]|uniref:Serine/threonine-protein phosphatase 7 long form-like protein n=1 Tax=Senna tora TaxID=362788 RepID=A0A834SFX7_9FABA|nr:serine/threonine-protein phosphatase 7 long form-like protein [Senna tora]